MTSTCTILVMLRWDALASLKALVYSFHTKLRNEDLHGVRTVQIERVSDFEIVFAGYGQSGTYFVKTLNWECFSSSKRDVEADMFLPTDYFVLAMRQI